MATPIDTGAVYSWVFDRSLYSVNSTYYVGNMEYSGYIKTNGTRTRSLDRVHNPEGYANNFNNPYMSACFYYFRRDHLGNTREVWQAPSIVYAQGNAISPASVVQRTQYYPGGLPWSEGLVPGWQPYKYNGKEFVEMHGYDTYDYGARGYYAAIGRFGTVDPLAEKYYWISPYAYCMNNPVKYVDLDGRDGMVTGTKYDPYVITANYYYQNGSLNKDQVEGLNSAVDTYNKSGGKNGVEIKNADGSTSYVKYNLSAQGVDDVDAARKTTAFETTSEDTRYYGNAVGTEPNSGGKGNEYGSANSIRVDFNVANINVGVESGMNSSSLYKGVAIHEIGHNLGGLGDHSDGTSVMDGVNTLIVNSQIGTTTTTTYIYPSMSNKFTKIIFNRRDTPKQDRGDGRLWTKKP